jgi:hypothetical protein
LITFASVAAETLGSVGDYKLVLEFMKEFEYRQRLVTVGVWWNQLKRP